MKDTGIFLFALAMFVFAFLLNNCSDNGTDPSAENGTLIVSLTDAPFPIDLVARADVTVDTISIKSQGDTVGDSLLILSTVEATYNLLDLRNGVTETLTQVEIPEGIYNQIRLRVVEAEIELTDGEVFVLNVPSGSQRGIKINIHPFLQISSAATAEVLLDFDLEKSFVMRGSRNNITGFNFKPVIRAVNNSDAGKFFGTVSDAEGSTLEDARIWAEADSVVSSTFSDANGNYALIGIPSGTYSLSATLEGYDTVTVSLLNMEAGDQVRQNFELSPQ